VSVVGASGVVVPDGPATSVPQAVKTASNAAVNLESRSRIGWVNLHPALVGSAVNSRARCVAQAVVGKRVTPSR
jgi:hypothetical protein